MSAVVDVGVAVGRAPRTATRGAALAGARAMAPLLVAVTPLGLVVGATAAETSVAFLPAWATSWTVYGATAQLVTLRLLGQGAGVALLLGTVALVNLRLAAYGASLAGHWRSAPRWWRLVASYLLVEPSYAVASEDLETGGDPLRHRWYYLGAGVTLWVGWQVVTLVGLLGGERVTHVVPADVALVLALLGMLVPMARRSGDAALAAAVGLLGGLVFAGLPLGTGTLVAGAGGVVAASVAKRRRPS